MVTVPRLEDCACACRALLSRDAGLLLYMYKPLILFYCFADLIFIYDFFTFPYSIEVVTLRMNGSTGNPLLVV